MTDKALEEILFRGAHEIVNSLVTYPGPQRVALLPNVVWLGGVPGGARRRTEGMT